MHSNTNSKGNVTTRTDEQWTVGRVLEWTTKFFADKGMETPRLDGEVLLASVLDCERISLYSHYDENINEVDRGQFRELVRQRAGGCPVAYLVGHRDFYTLRFDVTRDVLIPRPETEYLVMEALPFLREGECRFLELGIGSGAITVTLLHEVPNATAVAVDISPQALAVAARNAERHNVQDRLQLLASDLFAKVPQEPLFDLVISNPPYVATEEYESLEPTTRDFEPRLALDGGERGLTYYRQIIEKSRFYLRPGGMLALEIGATQQQDVEAIFAGNSGYSKPKTIPDLARKPRVITARRLEMPKGN